MGYRYFETFAKDKVLYPFGYGLSYTNFETKAEIFKNTEDELTVAATVTNIGDVRGKEVVQVYVKAPQGKLGNPARKLIGFAKTRELAPGEKEELVIIIPKYDMASYDDSGVTGHKSCYVLEEGTYEIFAGSDVRSAKSAGIYEEELRVIEQLQEAYAPIEKFRRMKAVLRADGTYQAVTEEVPVRTADPHKRREERMPKTLEYTGDKGYKLADVLDKKVSMDEVKDKEILQGKKELVVVLEEQTENLDDVVVTGIFRRSKELATGASVTVTGEQLKMVGNQNILQSLRTLDPSSVSYTHLTLPTIA